MHNGSLFHGPAEQHLPCPTVLYQNARRDWGVTGWIGAAYGDIARSVFIDRTINAIVERLPDVALIFEVSDEGHLGCTRYSVEEMARELCWESDRSLRHAAEIRTVDDLCRAFRDLPYSEQVVFCGTADQYKKIEEEREQRRYEKLAREFARKHNVNMNDFSFIRAVERCIDEIGKQHQEFNSHERRMEMHADHLFAGSGTSGYFDDLNYVNGEFASRLEDLEGILEFLGRYCPLLMARYEEAKLAGTWES